MQSKDGPSPTTLSSYQATLRPATRIGAITGTSFELFFTFYYWLSGYPIQAVWLQLAATLISLTGLIIIVQYTKHVRLAAQLVTIALFLCLIGPGIYTGGIDSSALVWLTFVPVAATIMGGNSSRTILEFHQHRDNNWVVHAQPGIHDRSHCAPAAKH